MGQQGPRMQTAQNKNKLIALGTGTSTGIPMIGCSCLVCTSLDHRDQRMRTSLFLETKNSQKFLIDTTPDLRTQLLTNKISAIDYAIITHDHADHLNGIDDLRPICFGPPAKEIPVFTNEATKASIEKRFSYIFNSNAKPHLGGGLPRLDLKAVELEKNISIGGEDFFFFNYPHGHGETMGFIHQEFAYIVDCMEIPPHLLAILKNKKLKLLIIDCLQRKSHGTHLTVERCFDYIREIKPEKTGLIHMGHDLSHRVLQDLAQREFGDSVFPLYDGQKLFY